MATKEKGRTFDGITRPSTDLYRENFNKIFGKKEKTTSEVTYGRLRRREETIRQ